MIHCFRGEPLLVSTNLGVSVGSRSLFLVLGLSGLDWNSSDRIWAPRLIWNESLSFQIISANNLGSFTLLSSGMKPFLQAKMTNSGICLIPQVVAHSLSSWKLNPWAFLGRQHILQICGSMLANWTGQFDALCSPQHLKHKLYLNWQLLGWWDLLNPEMISQKRQLFLANSAISLIFAAKFNEETTWWWLCRAPSWTERSKVTQLLILSFGDCWFKIWKKKKKKKKKYQTRNRFWAILGIIQL